MADHSAIEWTEILCTKPALGQLVAAATAWVQHATDHPNQWSDEDEKEIIRAVRRLNPELRPRWLDDPDYLGWPDTTHPGQHATSDETEVAERQALTLTEVRAEMGRQNTQWGVQNHPDIDTDIAKDPIAAAWNYRIPTASVARKLCELRFNHGKGTWADVLIEEVAEAIEAGAERRTVALRQELIQIAAVAVQWALAIDRRSMQATSHRETNDG